MGCQLLIVLFVIIFHPQYLDYGSAVALKSVCFQDRKYQVRNYDLILKLMYALLTDLYLII
jgi:hypothetical protein